jgi:hypothetical protein
MLLEIPNEGVGLANRLFAGIMGRGRSIAARPDHIPVGAPQRIVSQKHPCID